MACEGRAGSLRRYTVGMYESRESSMYVLLGRRYCSRGAQDPKLSSTSSMSSCAAGVGRDRSEVHQTRHQNTAERWYKGSDEAPVIQMMSAGLGARFFPCDSVAVESS
jgi:hypothetical protein